MEILFVSHKYPPTIGGMEKQSFELINGMRKHAVVHTLLMSARESRLMFFLRLNRRILHLLKANPGITTIHFNEGLIASWSLLHHGYEHLLRTVTVHGLDVVFPNRFHREKIIPAFNRFHLIFTVSRATADACITRGIDPSKIAIVANGVDHNLLLPELPGYYHDMQRRLNLDLTGKRVLVAMGRPVKRKGISWFLEKVIPLMKQDHVLLLIGPLNLRPSMGSRLIRILPSVLRKQLELAFAMHTDEERIIKLVRAGTANVQHLGRLATADIAMLLRKADAFVMPNIHTGNDMEGFGLVCLEASLCGAMVFASAVDGIPDAVHHLENGILLPPGDAHEWATTLDRYLGDPGSFHFSREAGMAYTRENFSWERMCGLYAERFRELISGREVHGG